MFCLKWWSERAFKGSHQWWQVTKNLTMHPFFNLNMLKLKKLYLRCKFKILCKFNIQYILGTNKICPNFKPFWLLNHQNLTWPLVRNSLFTGFFLKTVAWTVVDLRLNYENDSPELYRLWLFFIFMFHSRSVLTLTFRVVKKCF